MSMSLENKAGLMTGMGSAVELVDVREDVVFSATEEMIFAGYMAVAIMPSTRQSVISKWQIWSAVGSMSLCVAMLIASEFMPVSLLTPIAADLGATNGMAGQAISISGLFAVGTSLFIATIAGRIDRRHVLMGLTELMLVSLILIAVAPNFGMLMVARAFLGMAIGGFWALATATIMRLVPEESVPKALGVMYTGNALLGAAFGGLLLDHVSIAATMIGGSILLVLASLVIGNGNRIKPRV